MVAELTEVIGHVEGTVALIHQRLCLFDVFELLLQAQFGTDDRLGFGQRLQEDLVGIFLDIILLEVVRHVVLDLVDKPHIVFCLDLGRGQQHLHHCLPVIL